MMVGRAIRLFKVTAVPHDTCPPDGTSAALEQFFWERRFDESSLDDIIELSPQACETGSIIELMPLAWEAGSIIELAADPPVIRWRASHLPCTTDPPVIRWRASGANGDTGARDDHDGG